MQFGSCAVVTRVPLPTVHGRIARAIALVIRSYNRMAGRMIVYGIGRIRSTCRICTTNPRNRKSHVRKRVASSNHDRANDGCLKPY